MTILTNFKHCYPTLFVSVACRQCMCGTDTGILSICLSITYRKELNISSHVLQHMIYIYIYIILVFPVPNISAKFRHSHPLWRRWIQVWYTRFSVFNRYLAICGKRYKIGPVTMEW